MTEKIEVDEVFSVGDSKKFFEQAKVGRGTYWEKLRYPLNDSEN